MKLTDFIAGGTSSGLATAYTTLNAGEAISQGDLVVQAADGNAYYATDPAGAYPAMRQISQAVALYNQTIVPPTPIATGTSVNTTSVLLSNGNVAVVYAQFPAIYLTVLGPNGAVVVPKTTLTSTAQKTTNTIVLPFSVVALSGGGFALAYLSTSNTAFLGIYSNSGAVVVANFSALGATNQGSSASPICIQISNGNIVIANMGAATTGFAIYTIAGAVVLAPTAFSASYTPYTLAASNTGFVVGFTFSNSQNYTSATAYSSAGAALGTVTNTGYDGAGIASVVSVALSNGNVVVAVFAGTADTSSNALIISPSGSAVASNLSLGPAGGVTPYTGVLALPSGGFIIAAASGAAYVYSSTGVNQSTVTFDASPSVAYPLGVSLLANGNCVILYGSSTAIKVATLSASFALLGTPVSIGVIADNPIAIPLASAAVGAPPYTTVFLVAGGASASAVTNFGIFTNVVQACQPIGVASSASAQGNPVTTQVLGAAAMRLTFAKAYAINAQGNTPPGQKMSVAGNLAIMAGIQ